MRYDKWALYPNWEMAMEHQRANKVGRWEKTSHGQYQHTYRVCSCCLNVIEKESVGFCENTNKLDFLGSGFPLYFLFLKSIIFLMVIFLGTYGVIALQLAARQNQNLCPEAYRSFRSHSVPIVSSFGCNNFMLYFSRMDDKVTQTQEYLRVISWVMTLLSLFFLRTRLRSRQRYLMEKNRSLADYSVLIRNIPKEPGVAKKVVNFFQNAFSERIDIQNLTYVPEMTMEKREEAYMDQIVARKIQLMRKMKDSRPGLQEEEQLREIQYEEAHTMERIRNQFVRYDREFTNDTIICEMVIVSLNYESTKRKVLREFEEMSPLELERYFGRGGLSIRIEQAPAPQQIIWKNLHVPSQQKADRFMFTILISVGVLLGIAIIYFISLQAKAKGMQASIDSLADDPTNIVSSFVSLIFIALLLMVNFNRVIIYLLSKYLTKYQLPETSAQYEFSLAARYAVGTFWVVGVVLFFAQIFNINNSFLSERVLIEQQTFYIILTALSTPIVWLIYPSYVLKWIKRKHYQGREQMTQKHANECMEYPNFGVGKRYGEMIQLVWIAFFYASLIPLGTVLITISLVLSFFLDKYNIVRRSSVFRKLSTSFQDKILKMLQFSLVLYPTGQLLFDTLLRNDLQVSSIVFIVIGIIYMVLPLEKILDFVADDQIQRPDIEYRSIERKLPANYQTYHPIYRELRLQQYMKSRNFTTADNNINSNTELVLEQSWKNFRKALGFGLSTFKFQKR